MISQEQNTLRWPEEETPPPLDHKQPSTPASSWRGWSLWLRVLGVVVPFVASFARFFPIDERLFPLMHGIGVYLLVPLLVGVVSGGLLRSKWAVLVVPAALSIGAIMGQIFLEGGIVLPNMADPGFVEGVAFLLFFGVVPIAIGAAIGTPIGKKIEKRLQH